MSLGYKNYMSRLERTLQDVGEFLQPDDILTFLFQATLIYSKDRPLFKAYELTGDGTAFDFSLPSDWNEHFSYIDGDIEYPVDDNNQNIPVVDKNSWKYVRKLVSGSTVLYLRFLTFVPANSEKARFTYATTHTLDESTNTIKDNDSEAVICLAASLCYWALASRFAQTSETTIEADIIDYGRKSEIYSDLAKEKMSMYRQLMGIGDEAKKSSPATANVAIRDLDITFPGNLGEYLTHPSNIR